MSGSVMRRRLTRMAAVAASAVAVLFPTTVVRAQAVSIDKTIVAISCERVGSPNPALVRGSGVLVSPRGHVLTALHVVKDATNCKGSIGFADPGGGDPLVLQKQSGSADAALLRFSRPGTYDYVKYCRLEDWMIRREIYAAGFPGDTRTGVPSFRKGVLSTVFPVFGGVLETDSQTVAGMSGGPVFASDLKSFIGIVVNANFAASGVVSYYGILPTDQFKTEFELTPSERPCYHQTREIKLPPEVKSWRPRKPGEAANDLQLGVLADEGVCFLSAVWGQMNDPRDTVRVEIKEGQYFLTGENMSGSEHGGDVRCIWHD